MIITEQAAQVLAEIDAELAICEKATDGPWRNDEQTRILGKPGMAGSLGHAAFREDATFIASARTVCPKALRMNKTAIEGLLSESKLTPLTSAKVAAETLTALITQWNSK